MRAFPAFSILSSLLRWISRAKAELTNLTHRACTCVRALVRRFVHSRPIFGTHETM